MTDELRIITNNVQAWDGYMGDSFFSGIVVRFVDDDHVIVGTYLA